VNLAIPVTLLIGSKWAWYRSSHRRWTNFI